MMALETLQRFCATADRPERAALAMPFSRGEWTYATDARVIVRVARRQDVPEREETPNPENLVRSGLANAKKFAPLQFKPVAGREYAEVGQGVYALQYLELVAGLEGIEAAKPRGEGESLVFRFADGAAQGVGLICLMRPVEGAK